MKVEAPRNPALCKECGLVFNFGSARVTYEANATNKDCQTNCPSCGEEIRYSEARSLLLAEGGDEELAKLATELHEIPDRDHFETAGLLEIYKELGRRYAVKLTKGK